jgi:biopolymer transport protein TolQ
MVVDATATGFSPLDMFLSADLLVKAVMVGLVAASILSWWVMFSFRGRVRLVMRQTDGFETAMAGTRDVDALAASDAEGPAPRMLAAGVNEWRHSTEDGDYDLAGARERIATSLSATMAREIDLLSDRLNILATIGSVSPFVGLFGTVWGIMRSFTGIAQQQSTSLAVVAPGISEALFATALGLFAAIPAVIGYNRLSHRVNQVEGRLSHISDAVHSILSRRLETKA